MNAEKLTEQVEAAYWYAATLRQRALESPMLTEALEELHTTLEELRVTSSELRQHQESVEAELGHYLELFEEAPDGYLVTDRSGTIRKANRAATVLLNTQQQFLLGKPLSDFIADEQRPSFRDRLNRLLQGEQLQEWTVLLQPIDAAPFDAALTVNTIRDDASTSATSDRELIGLHVSVRDATESQRLLERERLVAASAQRIRQSLNLEEILNTTVAEVRQFLQTDRVIVYRFQPDWTGDVVAESVAPGLPSMAGMSICDPLGETYVQSLQRGEVTAIENIYTAGIDQYHIDLVARFGVVSDLVVPILYEEQLWGELIAHHCSGPRQWQQLEIDLLKSLATQAAIAIHQAQLYEQTQHQAQREQALNRVTRAIHQSLDLGTVFSTAVNEIRQLLQASRVVICHFASVEQGKVVAESVDPTCPAILGTIVRESRTIEHIEPYRQGKTRVIDDVQQVALRSGVAEFANQRQIRASLAVPILIGEEFWGILAAHECTGSRRWQPDEINLLEQLAIQVAIAIHQAQLYEQLTALNADLERQVQERTAQLHEQMQQLEVKTAELAASQSQMQDILDRTPAIIYIIGLDGCMKFANAEWYRVFEPLLGNQVVGRHLTEFLTPEHAESFFRENQQILAEGKVMTFENDMPLADGIHTYIRIKFPLRDANGDIYAFCGVSLDITERKQAEVETRTALEKEKELGELKSRFISMASHEFRTPLTIIFSSAQMLERYRHRWSNEQQLTHLRRIQSSVEHMTHLLDDVLLISKAEADKLEFNPVPLDLVQYCRELVEEMQPDVLDPQRIAFEVETQSIASLQQARMDEKLLRQILGNLLSNALKYSPNGGAVRFTLTCHQGRAVFQIQDSGIGIPTKDLPHLFESFHRASNTGKIPGTGLGLAIVKKSVEQHNGEIAVDSVVGAGTTFTVTLPWH